LRDYYLFPHLLFNIVQKLLNPLVFVILVNLCEFPGNREWLSILDQHLRSELVQLEIVLSDALDWDLDSEVNHAVQNDDGKACSKRNDVGKFVGLAFWKHAQTSSVTEHELSIFKSCGEFNSRNNVKWQPIIVLRNVILDCDLSVRNDFI
jgi:hypothetical protein